MQTRLGQLYRIAKPMLLLCMLALAGCSVAGGDVQDERPKVQGALRTDDLQSMAKNGRIIVAVGSNGSVFSSSDLGSSWKKQKLNDEASLIGVAVCPDGSFAVLDFYRRVWLGDWAAQHWTAVPIDTKAVPTAIACDPAGNLRVVGSYSTIMTSRDHGMSWQEQTLDQDAILTTIQFFDANNAVITGEFGTLARTHNGGTTWESAPPIRDEFYPFAAWFADAANGWVVGRAGRILHTADGGASWEYEASDVELPMYNLVPQGSLLYAVGEGGVVLRRSNGRWQVAEKAEGGRYLRGAVSLTPTRLGVAGGGATLATFSAGCTNCRGNGT